MTMISMKILIFNKILNTIKIIKMNINSQPRVLSFQNGS